MGKRSRVHGQEESSPWAGTSGTWVHGDWHRGTILLHMDERRGGGARGNSAAQADLTHLLVSTIQRRLGGPHLLVRTV